MFYGGLPSPQDFTALQKSGHASSVTASATGIDPDEVLGASDMASTCAGLNIIDASEIIYLGDFSAQNRFKESRENWFSYGDLILARDCLTYLYFKAFETGYCSGPTESINCKQRSMQYPLLEHSCSYLGLHVSLAQQQNDLADQALGFLNSRPDLDSATQALWYSINPDVAGCDVESGVHPLCLAASFSTYPTAYNPTPYTGPLSTTTT